MKINNNFHKTRTGIVKHNPNKKYKIVWMPDKIMGNYWGMNREASLELGFRPVPPKGTFFISESMKSKKIQKENNLTPGRIIAHEAIEVWHMENRGLKYKNAHAIAEEFDKNIRR